MPDLRKQKLQWKWGKDLARIGEPHPNHIFIGLKGNLDTAYDANIEVWGNGLDGKDTQEIAEHIVKLWNENN